MPTVLGLESGVLVTGAAPRELAPLQDLTDRELLQEAERLVADVVTTDFSARFGNLVQDRDRLGWVLHEILERRLAVARY